MYPSPPNTQALTSKTFTPPPLDGSLTVPELYDHNYNQNGSHPLFTYDEHQDGSPPTVKTVTWHQAGSAIYRAVRYVESQDLNLVASTTPVVAILAVIDQLSYFALTAGIIRAGYVAFPISPRNSEAGVANLLEKMGVQYLIVSSDPITQRTAHAACTRIAASGRSVELIPAPSFEDLYLGPDNDPEQVPPLRRGKVEDPVLILHSSGSTSFPKPVIFTHLNVLQWGRHPYYGEVDLCGRIFSNHSLPFFHAMGVITLYWATTTGITLSNFAPKSPPTIPTSDNVYTSATTVGATLIMCMPTYLEDWSMEPDRVEALKKFDAVLFGGGPIQHAIGDRLFQQGVNLYPFYGATETGGTSWFLPKRPPNAGWEYFQISPHCDPWYAEQDDEGSVVQIVFRRCETHTPAVINSGDDSYDTNDLLIRHPSHPDLFQIFGRSDDQIMHSTGEKTNPVPLETIINRHPKVSCCVMFGRGRFQSGLLVEPKPECRFDEGDMESLADFRNEIWPAVEEANQVAPSHSRIFKEMILVTVSDKPFQYTPKGTPRRHIIINEYTEEINEIYTYVEESAQSDIQLASNPSFDDCVQLVRKVVERLLTGSVIGDDDDLIQSGCDSLKITYIRNTILRALRDVSKDKGRSIPSNFVYQDPTISGLAGFITGILDPSQANNAGKVTDPATLMTRMVERYVNDFPVHNPSVETSSSEVILLTGSTGGLGAYILESLLLEESVSRVYALNRKNARRSIVERQEAAFIDRGIDLGLLNSPKLVFVEGDPSLDNLGLCPEQYEEIRVGVTCIMHIGWRVDFSVGLSSMEPLVAGTRRLVDFALSSPQAEVPRLMLASSIGVVKNLESPLAPEEPLLDPAVAISSGYPESKWVAERILTIASEKTPLKPVIVRIGQISGGRNGSWNPSEWVPSIVRSGQVLKCIPRPPGIVSWISAHTAASAMVEMRNSTKPFLHLVSPVAVSSRVVFQAIAEALGVPLVEYSHWLSALTSSATESVEETKNNPALMLLDFFQSPDVPGSSEDEEVLGFPRMSTCEAVKQAPSLSRVEPLGERDVRLWLEYWRKVGLLQECQ